MKNVQIQLKLISIECVTFTDCAGGKTALKPSHPLCRCSVGKGVRSNCPLGLPLQTIITNRRSRKEGFLKIPGVQQLSLGVRMITPDSGKTIRL